jgi:O-antigen biosynthesis protein
MSQRGQQRPHFVPEQGIACFVGRTVATTSPAWLRIEPIAALARHRWVELRYSSSLFDEPARPLIRFVTAKGDTITQPMNGPVLGAARWIGRIPDGIVSASISPVQGTGPFAFRLDSIRPIRRATLARQGLRQKPDWLYWAARSRLLNSRREAWQALGFATSGTAMDSYAKWQAHLARPIDLDGLDRPRSDWRVGPVFRFIFKLKGDDTARLGATIRSLRGQVYPRWSLSAVTEETTSPALLSAFRRQAAGDPRFSETALHLEQAKPGSIIFNGNDFVALIDSGDCLPDYALAVVAETLAQSPELELIYADEDCVAPDGGLKCPILKPDWSPVLQSQLGYVGRLALFRSRVMTPYRLGQLVVDEDGALNDLSREIPRAAIRHIRRILYHRHSPPDGSAVRTTAPVTRGIDRNDDPSQWPEVAVVIPTRDGAKLLAECFGGLSDKTDYPRIETVIVDNGSTAPDAIRLLQQIAGVPRTRVLQHPGPFNFSAMSNDGARATQAPVLLFLNNDVAMLDRNWLKAMVRWAIKPDTGVVGAKLLFPNRLLQHAGVVLGFGGIAGHVYRRSPEDHRGYLNQLTVAHEVSAVTGACMAVERSKFEAVGGFDAENLPVDLNDIDLCLRIAERGWANIWTPQATLIHHQSATRGIDSDPFALYRKERAYFVERWSHVLRDDPYFHPGLSLYAHDVALA